MPAHKKYKTEEEKIAARRKYQRERNRTPERKEYMRRWAEQKRKEDPDYFKPSTEENKKARARRVQKYGLEKVKERDRELTKIRRKNNPLQYMLYDARKRAKKKGVVFDLTVDDLCMPTFCPVFGVKLKQGDGQRTDDSPSLDRIIPSLGYVKGNVRIISHRANAIKNNATIDEIKQVLKYMEESYALVWNEK